jgi:hypothetical protein
VYRNGKLIQRGEVIVAIPKATEGPNESDPAQWDPEARGPEEQVEDITAADAGTMQKRDDNTTIF